MPGADPGLDILLVEPFLGGSHQQWAEGLRAHSRHRLEILGLSGRHWKWRMHGGAVTLARRFNEGTFHPDLILASDMLDLSIFLAHTRQTTHDIPVAVYFHENQLSYPWSPQDEDRQLKRDLHYSFINFSTAVAADHLFFNSEYHRESFFSALEDFLRIYPDHRELPQVQALTNRSSVLHLGMELPALVRSDREGPPVVLWNHRWEYDKAPEEFFRTLYTLQEQGLEFQLVVLGEQYGNSPAIFGEARKRLADRVLHWGFAPDRKAYWDWLGRCDVLPVTSVQDFFGGSIVEAMAAGVWPLLPDRLAYPGHIPASFREQVLYQPGELEGRLGRLLRAGIPDPALPAAWASRYDWRNLAPVYDRQFEKLLKK